MSSASPRRSSGRPSGASAESYRRRVRDTILSAAEQLYREAGHDAVSVRDVGRAAGVSTGSLYHHFRNRGQILEALVARIADRVALAFDEAAGRTTAPVSERSAASDREPGGASPDTLPIALRRGLEAVIRDRSTVSLVFGPGHDPRLRAYVYERFIARTHRFFAAHPQYLTASRDLGSAIPAELLVGVVSHAWQGALFGVLDWIVSNPNLTDRELSDVVRLAVQWNLSALAAHPVSFTK